MDEQKPDAKRDINDPSYVFPALFEGSGVGGLSKREYFAGLAMAGLMDPCEGLSVTECADLSVKQADALIAALKLNEQKV